MGQFQCAAKLQANSCALVTHHTAALKTCLIRLAAFVPAGHRDPTLHNTDTLQFLQCKCVYLILVGDAEAVLIPVEPELGIMCRVEDLQALRFPAVVEQKNVNGLNLAGNAEISFCAADLIVHFPSGCLDAAAAVGGSRLNTLPEREQTGYTQCDRTGPENARRIVVGLCQTDRSARKRTHKPAAADHADHQADILHNQQNTRQLVPPFCL